MHLSAHAITLIILATLVGSFLLDAVADLLNLNNLKHSLPDEFDGYFDEKKYRDSQNYLKTNTKFGFLTSIFDNGILLVFWFSGGFQFLDGCIRSLNFGNIVSGLLFIGILMLMKFIVSLPFSYYATFVIEEKFGFNKTSPRLFITDTLKSVILTAVLGGVLLSAILWFFETQGPRAWVMCWAASVFFLIVVQYIVPTWIMPLFNKFTPLEDGELKQTIMGYAKSINFSLSNIFIMDGSKRSSKSNAFFTGFGKNKRIVLFDTLIKDQSVDELLAVLAHEMGHYKKRHVMKRMGLAILQTGFLFFLVSFFISHEGLFRAFFMEVPSVYAGLVFFGMLYAPIDLILSIFLNMSSRKDEYEADRFSAKTTKNPAALITALKKLSRDNLSNLTPHPFYVFINYSHPPVLDRIKHLQEL